MSGGTLVLALVSDVAVRAAASTVHWTAVGVVFAHALVGALSAESAFGTGVRASGAGASGRTVALAGGCVALAGLCTSAVEAAA